MVTYDENLLQAEQDKIEKVYTAIGERYYAAHKDDNNSEFPDLMDAIKACEQTMADHKAEVLRQHELMICPSCGAEIRDTESSQALEKFYDDLRRARDD